jgi:cytidine deaminase
VFTFFSNLSEDEQELVRGVWESTKNAYVPQSDFPVGCYLIAENEEGGQALFRGCNVETHRFFSATICAERNAITTAVAAGYRKLRKLALAFDKYQGPGASPCGLCRQMLIEFGPDADLFNMADLQNNVVRMKVADLLPKASSPVLPFESLSRETRRLVRRCVSLAEHSYTPYSKRLKAGAVLVATNGKGKTRAFGGAMIENASYGGTGMAGCGAMHAAHTAGFVHDVTLVHTVADLLSANPIEGEVLQVLREFGMRAKVLLVGPDRAVVHSSIEELLPDSFGPQSLG